MIVGRYLFPAVILLGACSLVLDPDSLQFQADANAPGGDSAAPVDAHVDAEAPGVPEPQDAPDAAVPDVAPPDTSPAEVIQLASGGETCAVSFKLETILLTGTCARACSGDAGGWPIALVTAQPGASWHVEATQGFVPVPDAGKGTTFATEIAFPSANCGSTKSVPDFTLLVTLTWPGGKADRTIPVHPTLDSTCGEVVCE